jgi:hypothetical protein
MKTVRLHAKPSVFGAVRQGLDVNLLRSPQLYSLKLGTKRHSRYDTVPEMEFNQITACIARLKTERSEDNNQNGLPPLKILRIYSVGRIVHTSEEIGVRNFNISPHTIMPSLTELHLPAKYDGNSQHIAAWLDAADWSCLKSLTLSGPPSQQLLPTLTSKIPQLNRLIISGYPHTHDTKVILSKFVHSITALEELFLDCLISRPPRDQLFNDDDDGFWVNIVSLHGKSLKALRVCWHGFFQVGRENSQNRTGWNSGLVESLVDVTPELRYLELDCLLDKSYKDNEPIYSWVSLFHSDHYMNPR